MAVNVDAVGTKSGPFERSWDSKDALLYAVGVGAGADDPSLELQYTTENSKGVEQKVLPTFAVIAGGGRADFAAVGEINMANLVHGEQGFVLHQPIPVKGSLRSETTITGIYDKGSGLVIAYETEAVDAGTGEKLMTTRSSAFIRGAGGFGGDRGPTGPKNEPPDRVADHTVTYKTRVDQALTYRLSGDRNPLHSDPEFAKLGGFPRPILHGLCTYGFTGRALLHSLCDGDSSRFRSMDGRFARPVFPGQSLTISIWRTGEGQAVFQTTNDAGDVVVSEGGVTFDV